VEERNQVVAQLNTVSDDLMTAARDLGMTVVAGKLGPPSAGQMWIGSRALDDILCPDGAEREVAILIAPGGSGRTYIQIGHGTLSAENLNRLARQAGPAGGSVYHGWLAVMTPTTWRERHRDAPKARTARATPEGAEANWPANFGDHPVLFLGNQSIFSLLAQVNVGRTITMLVGTIAT
jgi:hypothetical protein